MPKSTIQIRMSRAKKLWSPMATNFTEPSVNKNCSYEQKNSMTLFWQDQVAELEINLHHMITSLELLATPLIANNRFPICFNSETRRIKLLGPSSPGCHHQKHISNPPAPRENQFGAKPTTNPSMGNPHRK